MSHDIRNIAHTTPMLVLAMAMAACADTELPAAPFETAVSYGMTEVADPGVAGDLAAVREATAHLHRFENAAPAGWSFQATECLENPPAGGMGVHFGNMEYYLDGEANLLEPEVLLYEPQRNGELRLVAVEYLVPFFAWEGEGEPVLFGREMTRDDDHEEWLLHVWLWKHNPNGMFEDWNPNVSCEHAD